MTGIDGTPGGFIMQSSPVQSSPVHAGGRYAGCAGAASVRLDVIFDQHRIPSPRRPEAPVAAPGMAGLTSVEAARMPAGRSSVGSLGAKHMAGSLVHAAEAKEDTSVEFRRPLSARSSLGDRAYHGSLDAALHPRPGASSVAHLAATASPPIFPPRPHAAGTDSTALLVPSTLAALPATALPGGGGDAAARGCGRAHFPPPASSLGVGMAALKAPAATAGEACAAPAHGSSRRASAAARASSIFSDSRYPGARQRQHAPLPPRAQPRLAHPPPPRP